MYPRMPGVLGAHGGLTHSTTMITEAALVSPTSVIYFRNSDSVLHEKFII